MRYHLISILEWPLPKQQQQQNKITSFGEDIEKLEPLSTTGRNIKWYIIYGKLMAFPQKIKHRIFIWSRRSTSENIPKKIKSASQRFSYTPLYSSVIHGT